MWPVLMTVFGVPVQSYGVSKALAAFAAAWLLGRAFASRGLPVQDAYSLTWAGALWGFAGAKVYYLVEHAGHFSWHHLGGSGFTWYGGMLAGTTAVLVTAHRRKLPLLLVAGLAVAPLSVAYGIGRLGCLLAGDGTYGKPSDLPWAMAFPNGVVPTDVPVQPTPLYEALAAFALAVVLWKLQQRHRPELLLAVYLLGAGGARLLIELARTNKAALWGLTQPQLWSLVMLAAGFGAAALAHRASRNPVLVRSGPTSLDTIPR